MKRIIDHETIKQKHNVNVVLFEGRNFFETMREDAEILSKVTGLTKSYQIINNENICLCSFPVSSLDLYLPMLTKSFNRVAIVSDLTK